MVFINNRFFKKQSFEILKSGIQISKKTIFDSIEYETSFEKIHNKLRIQTSVSNGLLITAFFFITTGFIVYASGNIKVTTVFFTLALLSIVIAFTTVLKKITIDCYDGTNIELYFTKTNKEDVIVFANQIIKSSNTYLLNKYGRIDKALPIENQLGSLDFLRNKEIISEEEYESLKNQLLGRENKTSIGFHK